MQYSQTDIVTIQWISTIIRYIYSQLKRAEPAGTTVALPTTIIAIACTSTFITRQITMQHFYQHTDVLVPVVVKH